MREVGKVGLRVLGVFEPMGATGKGRETTDRRPASKAAWTAGTCLPSSSSLSRQMSGVTFCFHWVLKLPSESRSHYRSPSADRGLDAEDSAGLSR